MPSLLAVASRTKGDVVQKERVDSRKGQRGAVSVAKGEELMPLMGYLTLDCHSSCCAGRRDILGVFSYLQNPPLKFASLIALPLGEGIRQSEWGCRRGYNLRER